MIRKHPLRRLSAAAIGVAFATALLALPSAPAAAHTQLIGTSPEEGASVTAPRDVTLTFSEDLLELGAEMTVTDAAGQSTPLDVTFPGGAVAQAMLPELAPGTAAIAWRVVADDGHPVEGTLTFVVTAAASTASPTATPTATASVEPVIANFTVAPQADDGAASMPKWVWALLAAVVAAGAVTAIIASSRR